jgi:hypothetical protein
VEHVAGRVEQFGAVEQPQPRSRDPDGGIIQPGDERLDRAGRNEGVRVQEDERSTPWHDELRDCSRRRSKDFRPPEHLHKAHALGFFNFGAAVAVVDHNDVRASPLTSGSSKCRQRVSAGPDSYATITTEVPTLGGPPAPRSVSTCVSSLTGG